MTKTALIAQITGDAYRHMLDWRNELDLLIMQEQFNKGKRVLALAYEPETHFVELSELPAPGTARLHPGDFGGGYDYYFFHTPTGWMVHVTDMVQDTIRYGLTKKVPPLIIEDTAAISVAIQQLEDVRIYAPTGLMDESSDDSTPTDRATFPIAGEFYHMLLACHWAPERLTEYTYRFAPLSVGLEIIVEHPASGTKNHLTKDVGW